MADNVTNLKHRPARETINHYIKNPPENSRVLTLTPEDATWIELQLNSGENRSKKPGKIKSFSEQMKAQEWGLTGDTIKFSNQGVLVDGQNRLAACVRAGVPFRTHIVFGVDHALFSVMDRGKPRNSGDVLQIAGYSNTTTLSSAVRWTYLLATGQAKRRDTFEPTEILTMLRDDYIGLPEIIPAAMEIYRSVRSPPGLTTAVLYLAKQRRPKDWQEFARIWELSGQDKKGAPIKKMLERLSQLKAQSHGRVHDTIRAALAVMAWNAYASGRNGRGGFKWELSDDFPEMVTR